MYVFFMNSVIIMFLVILPSVGRIWHYRYNGYPIFAWGGSQNCQVFACFYCYYIIHILVIKCCYINIMVAFTFVVWLSLRYIDGGVYVRCKVRYRR